MDGLKEFLESSTIHGLAYIATNRGLGKLLWLCIVIAGFSGATLLIQLSFSSWEESPISTTIETSSISDLALPEVVVCPARKSFTTLNPDLIMADKKSWDENTRQRLLEFVLEATFDLNVESKYKTMTSFYEKDKFFNLYKGESKIFFPNVRSLVKQQFFLETSAVSGTFSTPYYGETFILC